MERWSVGQGNGVNRLESRLGNIDLVYRSKRNMDRDTSKTPASAILIPDKRNVPYLSPPTYLTYLHLL